MAKAMAMAKGDVLSLVLQLVGSIVKRERMRAREAQKSG
jgi:hypothetical protein